MGSDIDEIIEKAIGVTDEDRESGHSLSVYEEEGQHFYVPDLRAVCEAGIKSGIVHQGACLLAYEAGVAYGSNDARRELARTLLEDFGKVRVNWELDECERVLFERLREIAEEEA